MVLPVGCSLQLLVVDRHNNPFLLQVSDLDTDSGHKSSRDSVLRILLGQVQQKIGGVLNPSERGLRTGLPTGYITR